MKIFRRAWYHKIGFGASGKLITMVNGWLICHPTIAAQLCHNSCLMAGWKAAPQRPTRDYLVVDTLPRSAETPSDQPVNIRSCLIFWSTHRSALAMVLLGTKIRSLRPSMKSEAEVILERSVVRLMNLPSGALDTTNTVLGSAVGLVPPASAIAC